MLRQGDLRSWQSWCNVFQTKVWSNAEVNKTCTRSHQIQAFLKWSWRKYHSCRRKNRSDQKQQEKETSKFSKTSLESKGYWTMASKSCRIITNKKCWNTRCLESFFMHPFSENVLNETSPSPHTKAGRQQQKAQEKKKGGDPAKDRDSKNAQASCVKVGHRCQGQCLQNVGLRRRSRQRTHWDNGDQAWD